MLKVKQQLNIPRKIETPTVPLPMSSVADDSSVQESQFDFDKLPKTRINPHVDLN